MKRAIIIMAKVPTAGTVKTRLEPFLSPAQCASLARAFLRDAETKARSVCDRTILAFSPADQIEALKNITHSKNLLVKQTGENLGERMSDAFEFAFAHDSDAVVMIGTDSPTFPPEFIVEAFAALERDADIALGRSADGGFYLIGLGRSHPEIYENVCWSTASVFEQTAANAERLGLRLFRLPDWYDVDTPEDFSTLQHEMLAEEKARRIAPETFRWLKGLKS